MIESVLKAYYRDAFTQTNTNCPVELKKIETYIQILQPIHMVNIGLQSNFSTISCVIPCIIKLIDTLEKLELEAGSRFFANLLIEAIKLKFKYELESDFYLVRNIKLSIN